MRNTRVAFLAVSALVATGLSASAACGQGADWSQAYKLAPNDSVPGDLFGWDVAVSGEVVIVGAPHQSDNGEWSGSAYLFDVATGVELYELNAEDAEEGDAFGLAVDVSGCVAIVGAYLEDGDGVRWGAAYLFDVMTGTQLHKLVAEDPGQTDNFGWAVAISGGVAIVGSYRDDDGGENSGSAYLFDVATGAQLHKLTADDAAAEDWFGESVAIANGVALIGAPGDACINFVSHVPNREDDFFRRGESELMEGYLEDFRAVFGFQLQPFWTRVSRIPIYSPVFSRGYRNPPPRSRGLRNVYFAGNYRTFPSIASTGTALGSGIDAAATILGDEGLACELPDAIRSYRPLSVPGA